MISLQFINKANSYEQGVTGWNEKGPGNIRAGG